MCGFGSCLIFNIIITIIMMVFAIIYSMKFGDSYEFENYKCNITDVHYPLEIPTGLLGYENFDSCDCGRRCISDLGICNKIFITEGEEDNILMSDRFDSDDSKCTFREKNCKNGENYMNRLSKVSNNIIDMQYYVNFINSTQNIDCYKFENIYFFDNYDYLVEVITFWSLFVFFGLCCISISHCIKKYNEINNIK